MAQKSQIVKPASTKIVTAKPGDLSPERLARMKADAGKGQSTHVEDTIVPFLKVLQPLSPQCIKKGQGYIEGAEPGDFYLTASSDPLIKNEDGFIFQPCFRRRDWVEWVPREDGGGFAGRFDYNYQDRSNWGRPRDAQRKEDGWTFRRADTGNDLIDTIYFVGYVWREGLPEAFCIAFAGTAHKVGRTFITMLKGKHLPTGEQAPIYDTKWLFKSRIQTNDKGSWWLMYQEDEGWMGDKEAMLGAALFDQMATDEKKIQETERVDTSDTM